MLDFVNSLETLSTPCLSRWKDCIDKFLKHWSRLKMKSNEIFEKMKEVNPSWRDHPSRNRVRNYFGNCVLWVNNFFSSGGGGSSGRTKHLPYLQYSTPRSNRGTTPRTSLTGPKIAPSLAGPKNPTVAPSTSLTATETAPKRAPVQHSTQRSNRGTKQLLWEICKNPVKTTVEAWNTSSCCCCCCRPGMPWK